MRLALITTCLLAAAVSAPLTLAGSPVATAMPEGYVGQTDITSPQSGDELFGGDVKVLTNGNYVVADRLWDDGAVADVGAVYLYDGLTDTVISTLTGSHSDDQVGSRIISLENGNFVVQSSGWDDGGTEDVGAITWVNGVTGLDGVVSTSNSVHGSTANDQIRRFGVGGLPDGDLVIGSTTWDNGAVVDVGIVSRFDAAAGNTGPLTTLNSLHGNTASDEIGSRTVSVFENGDVMVSSPKWDNGAETDAGAATLIAFGDPFTGPVSTSNSLHGSTTDDQVASFFPTEVSGGAYAVISSFWNGVGAVTWVDSTTGTSGPVTTANSLYGASPNDGNLTTGSMGGSISVSSLGNGNSVAAWNRWDNGAVEDAGAVVFAPAGGVTGPVTTANSLYGTTADDFIGLRRVLANGNYVAGSGLWDLGSTEDVGVYTWVDGTTGVTGAVTMANSLHGTQRRDGFGAWIDALSNGNYLVGSSQWDLGAIEDAGALTWADGTTGVTGPITTSNSLHGSSTNDLVGGIADVTEVGTDNFTVTTEMWDLAGTPDVGAVTWVDGSVGITGPVTTSNSLHGTTAGDRVGDSGSFTGSPVEALAQGNYVVPAPYWDSGAVPDVGAVVWADGNVGITGPVTTSNSLHGTSPGDKVGEWRLGGSGGSPHPQIFGLPNGNYVVPAMAWDNGAIPDVGAATWVDGSVGMTGPVTTSNALYGTSANDQLGSATPVVLNNGDYVNRAFFYDDGADVDATSSTFAFADSGITGPISRDNSAIGTTSPSPFVNFRPLPEFTANGSIAIQTSQNRVILMRLNVPDPTQTEPVIVSTDPARLLDTRVGEVTIDGQAQGSGQVVGGTEIEIPIAGRGGVPTDAKAVVVNITAVNPAGRGFITIHPCGTRPLASSLNYAQAGIAIGNEVIAKLSPAGSICAFTRTTTHLTADAVGYVPADSPYVSVDPARLLDTRVGQVTIDGQAQGAGTIAGGTEIELQIAGRAGVPSNATAAVLNVTAVNPVGRGFITIHPCGTRPLASSLNYAEAGTVIGNEVITKLSPTGTVCIFTRTTTHLTADLVGHLPGGTGYSPLDPARLLDTRVGQVTIDGQAQGAGTIAGGTEIELQIAGRAGVPSNATAAVLNVTAVNPVGRGFITIHPCGTRPLASSLNYAEAGTVIGNEVITKLSPTGTVCIFTRTTTHLTADLVGHIS